MISGIPGSVHPKKMSTRNVCSVSQYYPGAENMISASDLLVEFLRHRGLTAPDGRPLYEYRCTDDEFESFAQALGDEPPIYPVLRTI
jgi:hypothetical protein